MRKTFRPPVKEQAGQLDLLVKSAATKGADVVAVVEAWNGVLVHSDDVRLTAAGSRARFVKAVCGACPVAVADHLAAALLKLGSQIPDQLHAATSATDTTEIEQNVDELKAQAAAVLESSDPLGFVIEAFRNLGYGGDIKPVVITYLAVTSRLLAMRPGAMPVHLLLIGPPSAGKSYTLSLVLRLHPPEAYHTIDAGSPRVLIYDSAPLKHRVLVFSEADSLPAGEDNPAASAVRGLLQEHHLAYKVTVLNSETGKYEVQEVTKEGPTVLITTAVRQLGEQLNSRLFALDVPYDLDQLKAALATQARIELEGAPEPDQDVVAFHSYLQAMGPWDVTVPYAQVLADLIGQSASAPRINRDFSRLLALIKAVTVLRHEHRQTVDGRLVAESEDYQTVFDLVAEMYETAVTGVTLAVRTAVTAVTALKAEQPAPPVTVTSLGKHLKVSKMAASRAVRMATKYGWLTNSELRKGYPADLILGEPMPPRAGLPEPAALVPVTTPEEECNAVTHSTEGEMCPPPFSVSNGVTPKSQTQAMRSFRTVDIDARGEGGSHHTVEAVTALHPSQVLCVGVGCGRPGDEERGPIVDVNGYALHYNCTLPPGSAA